MNTNTSRNCLTQPQAFQLFSWWGTQADDILRLPNPNAAQRATAALGFNVSESNIRSARIATGKGREFNRRTMRRAPRAAPSIVLRLLASELIRTQAKMNALLVELNMLPVVRNPDLTDIAAGRRPGNGHGGSPE